MANIFDNYSNLGFYQALHPAIAGQVVPQTGGLTIDLQGATAATMIVQIGSTHFAAASELHLALQHGLASAAGVSTWSLVGNSQLIHSVFGGYNSTGETGIFHSLPVGSDSGVYACGYKMDNTHRYLRLYVSGDGGVGSMIASALAIVERTDWPVNVPVNN